MRKFVAIEVGPRSSVEVDVEGRWLVRWGVPITIRGFKFFFVPMANPKNVRIEAYSLDSLKTFDRFHISHEVAWKGCSTEEGFIRTVMPFITRIDKRLDNLDDDGWKTVFRDEYISAIAQCGARNSKEAKLLEDFKKRK